MSQLDSWYRNISDGSKFQQIVDTINSAPHFYQPKKWLQYYNQSIQTKESLRDFRLIIQYQTFWICDNNEGAYRLWNEEKKQVYQVSLVPKELQSTLSYEQMIKLDAQKTILYNEEEFRKRDINDASSSDLQTEGTQVDVIEGDCLEVAIALRAQGFHPLVLNMASPKRPGGGYQNGAGAQEENLFRRTNLYQILEDQGRKLCPQRKWKYPLDEFEAVYSPRAIVFRGSEASGYPMLTEPVPLSFIALAAYRNPPIEMNSVILPTMKQKMKLPCLTEKFADKTKRKIRLLFHIAKRNKHDCLVLSALGAGAYQNPPHDIARCFHEVIKEQQFKNWFKKIVFAIIDDHNAHREHNPLGNVKPFKMEFASMMNTPKESSSSTESSSESHQEVLQDSA